MLPLRPRVWTWNAVVLRLAALAGYAWVILFCVRLGTTLDTVWWNADAASPLTIGQLLPAAPSDATVTIANFPWYDTLWFELLTRHLPFHRQIWEIGPWIVSVTAIGLLAWVTAKVAGRWAGSIVALALVCGSSGLLSLEMRSSWHNATVVYAALLDGFLVLLVARGGMLGRWTVHVPVCWLIASVAAVGAASDELVFLTAIAPFAITGFVIARLVPKPASVRLALTTAGVTGWAIIGSWIVVAAMRARHFTHKHFPISFTTWDQLIGNALSAVQSVASLFSGTFDAPSAISARSLLDFGCALIVVAALVTTARYAIVLWRDLPNAESPLRTAHVAFWLLAAALPLLAFVVTSVAADDEGRYLIATAYGSVVVVAVAAAGGSDTRRLVVALATCVIVAAGIVSLATDFDPSAGNQMTREVATLAQAENVQYGYAVYQDAEPLTWRLHGAVEVYPVMICPKAPHGLCRFPFNVISSWYTPRAHVHTFLIVDRRYGMQDPGLTLGGPSAIVPYNHYMIYVYDYDIASILADPRIYAS